MSWETKGPHVSVATFCETVIEGKDGVLSVIRMIDRIIVTAQGPEAPDVMPTQTLALHLVIVLKSGAAKGRQTVTVRPQLPSGNQLDPINLPVLFESEDRGQNLIMNFQYPAQEEGLYWWDILLGDQLLTRVPLRVVYQQIRSGT
jgi:hypothetical protein